MVIASCLGLSGKISESKKEQSKFKVLFKEVLFKVKRKKQGQC